MGSRQDRIVGNPVDGIGAGILIFSEPDRGVVGGIVPIVPARRVDDRTQIAVEVSHGRVLPPGTSQVDHHAGVGGHLAAEENVAVSHVILGGSRRQGRPSVGVEFAALENSRGGPENKVRVPRDIAVLEILAAAVPINGVVGPEELAVDEDFLVPVDVDGQGRVMGGRGGVLEGEVVGVKTGGVDIGA